MPSGKMESSAKLGREDRIRISGEAISLNDLENFFSSSTRGSFISSILNLFVL
jgi:hypothetical protein